MRARISNEKLRRAFVTLMARAEKPITQVRTFDRRGPARQVYRLPNGQLLLLRTNNQRAVMSLAAGPAPEDRLPFETEDFLGIAIPGERPDRVAAYLVPADEAARAMRDAHRQHLERNPGSDVRVLKFDNGNERSVAHGFANRWAPYFVGAIDLAELDTVAVPNPPAAPIQGLRVNASIAEAKRNIALEAGVPESAVRITIEY